MISWSQSWIRVVQNFITTQIKVMISGTNYETSLAKCNVMAFCFEQSSFTSLFEQMCAFVNTLCNPSSMIILIINISQ